MMTSAAFGSKSGLGPAMIATWDAIFQAGARRSYNCRMISELVSATRVTRDPLVPCVSWWIPGSEQESHSLG
jgi:hypothetical protein